MEKTVLEFRMPKEEECSPSLEMDAYICQEILSIPKRFGWPKLQYYINKGVPIWGYKNNWPITCSKYSGEIASTHLMTQELSVIHPDLYDATIAHLEKNDGLRGLFRDSPMEAAQNICISLISAVKEMNEGQGEQHD